MLEGLLHHKKEEKEYLCALMISEERIDAALWESVAGGEIKILKTAQCTYNGEWESAIQAADQAVTEVESALPEGKELKKTVFGLFPEWITEDRIKETKLKLLKELTKALSLTPLGFVDMPSAINHMLQKEEGVAQTVVLVGVEGKHLTVSLFKIGKLSGSVTLPRTSSISSDLEKGLQTFVDVEVLPSKILLYGTDPALISIKSELLNYPWQKKANFLHVPKVDSLPVDFAVKAVAASSSSELTIATQETADETEEVHNPIIGAAVSEQNVQSMTSDLVKENNESAIDTEVADPEVALTMDEEEDSNVTAVSVPSAVLGQKPRKKLNLPKISLPKLSFSLPLPNFSLGSGMKIKVLGIILIAIFLLGGAGTLIFWFAPKATITLLVKSQNLDKLEDITLDPTATSADPAQKILPAKAIQHEVSGSVETKTTGKKTVGEQAKGEVTIYNKTLNTKTLTKGTVLTAGKLKFTLDEEISVASASESVGSLTYGTSKAKATAGAIGVESNVASGTEFAVADFPNTSYSARNDQAFSGGTSREIAVVSRDDVTKLREEVIKSLTSKGESELAQKQGSGEKLLENSSVTKVVSEVFNKEVGEETDTLSVTANLSLSALVYSETDFNSLLEQLVATSVPENYSYKKENVKVKVENVTGEEDQARIFTTRITLELLPNVETDDLAKTLANKSIDQATDYLKLSSGIAGVEFDIQAPFESQKRKLPLNSSNITIKVSPV